MEATECQRRGGGRGRQRGSRFQRQDSSGSVVISAAAHYTDPAEDIIDVLFRYRDSTGIHMNFSLSHRYTTRLFSPQAPRTSTSSTHRSTPRRPRHRDHFEMAATSKRQVIAAAADVTTASRTWPRRTRAHFLLDLSPQRRRRYRGKTRTMNLPSAKRSSVSMINCKIPTTSRVTMWIAESGTLFPFSALGPRVKYYPRDLFLLRF